MVKYAEPHPVQGLMFSRPFCIHGLWMVQKI